MWCVYKIFFRNLILTFFYIETESWNRITSTVSNNFFISYLFSFNWRETLLKLLAVYMLISLHNWIFDELKLSKNFQTERTGLLRFPSVTICSQSEGDEVKLHFHRAPDFVVFGCKFCPKGAPTSNLQKEKK